MKKKEKLHWVLISIALLIFLSDSVIAMVAVSPGQYEADFVPNLRRNFVFRYSLDSGVDADVSVEGDLAQYVKLSTNHINTEGSVVASVELPYNIEVPGKHGILICAKQNAPEGAGVGIVGNAKGNIIIKVPYPGKYAEAEFIANNANPGEPVNLKLNIHNLGKENIAATATINIYDSFNNSLAEFALGNSLISTASSQEFAKVLDTSNYKSGDYRAVAVVDYGSEKKLNLEKTFKLGRLFVGIANYTREFERGKINRMEIETESFWNRDINGLYADVAILNHSITFLTPSTTIGAWARTFLTGFFDSSEIKENMFSANVSLHYEGQVTNKIVEMKFKAEKTNYTIYIIIGTVAVVIAFGIIIFFFLWKRRKDNDKNRKKKHS